MGQDALGELSSRELEILQRVLRFRLTSPAYAGFLAAGVFVYLAGGR